MMWKNTRTGYGLINIMLHWLIAVWVVGLFALGLYMVGLGYYDPWYHRGPALHKSLGLLLFAALVLRLLWRFINPVPYSLAKRRWERSAASIGHGLLYLVLFLVILSGYLIAAADGRAIAVFDWFSVPALRFLERQADLAGDFHEVLAWCLIGLAVVHSLAALKHHFIDRDPTLVRMLWPRGEDSDQP